VCPSASGAHLAVTSPHRATGCLDQSEEQSIALSTSHIGRSSAGLGWTGFVIAARFAGQVHIERLNAPRMRVALGAVRLRRRVPTQRAATACSGISCTTLGRCRFRTGDRGRGGRLSVARGARYGYGRNKVVRRPAVVGPRCLVGHGDIPSIATPGATPRAARSGRPIEHSVQLRGLVQCRPRLKSRF
jgi:hypothetical protein